MLDNERRGRNYPVRKITGSVMNDNDPTTVATVAPATTATTDPKPTKRRAARAPINVGVVGVMPNGFDAIRDALRAVNANTDMRVDAIRADVKRVARAIVAAIGDRAIPPSGRGRFTGLRTYDFQNTLYAVNDRPDWRFTDRTLCIAWAVELCANKCDFPAHARYIASTRTDYINGRHGSNVIDPRHRVSHAWPTPSPATE